MSDWAEFKRDADVLLECANALHRAPQPIMIHPSQMLEMYAEIVSLVQAVRGVQATARVPTTDKEVLAHLAARDALAEAEKAFKDLI